MNEYLFCSDSLVNCTRTYEGGCTNNGSMTLNLKFDDRAYTVENCHNQCVNHSQCGGFFVGTEIGTSTGICFLVKEGCLDDDNTDWDYYAMTDCKRRGLFPY